MLAFQIKLECCESSKVVIHLAKVRVLDELGYLVQNLFSEHHGIAFILVFDILQPILPKLLDEIVFNLFGIFVLLESH